MTDGRRRRLILLVSARTKLDAAANLVKVSTVDLARADFPCEHVRRIAAEIDSFIASIALLIQEIPST